MTAAYTSTSMSPIANTFQRIASRTVLRDTEVLAFARHQTRIESSVEGAFSVSKFLRMGSVVRGTAVSGQSDLDLLVVLRRDEVFWGGVPKAPSTMLANMRGALQDTFPSTAMARDGQAVVVEFSDGRNVDVVPAWWHSALSNGWPLYAIPGGGSDWLLTAPDSHSRYIVRGDNAAGGKLKSVARILKYWKTCRTPILPLSGFHVELLLAESEICNGARRLSACVADCLALLDRRACRALQDPCGVSGLIAAAGTSAKLDRLRVAASSSADNASTALEFENSGDVSSAKYYWNRVFNGKFG